MNTIFLRSQIIGLFAFVLSCLNSFGQIVINEICPTNISVIQNSNGDYDDWIEIHNSGASTVNLAGYGLTDDPLKPFRFTFPSYSVNAGKKVLVFASDSTSEVICDHWEMAIDAATSWKYAAGSAGMDTNWRNPSFNQASWSSGNGGIGFGDGDDATTISVGASVMMRKTFNIPDTSQVLKAILIMDYDDGFVAYLNGVEIARNNIGTIGVRPFWNELANSSHEAARYQGEVADSFFISPKVFKSLLRPTNNVLAIETHNTPASSNDLSSIPFLFFGMRSPGSTFSSIPSWFHVPVKEYFNAKFKLNRFGETIYLTNPSGTLVNQVTYPSMEIDNSYCRKPDGSSTWCFVSTPTPDASNNSSTCYTGYAFAPVFSKAGGYYPSSITLILSTSTPGGVIRYTTNGNTPTASSPVYSSPITISSSKTVRAKVFASGYMPSPLVTNSYFINANTHLSTFSVTTDSSNLWDYNTGIYVLGPGAASSSPYKGANFWMDWEKPASVEYFDKNKNLVVKFESDIKIYGNYSRAKDQKSFEIKLSDKYGTGEFTYPIFPDKSYVDNINNIVLRNSGTDWNEVHFRDAFMERMMKTTYTGYLAAEPAIMYLNGSYWGVYCINENHDHHWMKDNFGLEKSDIDYLKESGSNLKIQEGTDASFWTLYNYASVQTPTTQTYYNYVNTLLDLKNYTDYFAAETFYNNGDWIGDWTNNIQLWRPNSAGSKWRYLLYDLDFGLGLSGSVNENRLSIARNPAAFSYSSEMFDALLKNPTYKRYFINRYADLMNTVWLSSKMDAVMRSFKDTMSYDMVNHFAKWGSSISSWNSRITSMMNFANARPAIVRGQINTEFGLSGQVTLTLNVSPAGSGRIEISTITPTSYPWSGIYFNGNPVTLTAIPNPGYTFDHFRSNVTISSNNTNQQVTYNFTSADQITAYFNGSSVAAKLCVSELNYNSDSAYNAGDWIELHNYGTTSLDISGWKLSDGSDNHMYEIPTGTAIPANGYLVLCEDTIKFDSQFPTVNNRIGLIGFNFNNGGDQIRIFNHLNTQYLTFFYLDLAPWPLLPDGGGYTCELLSNTSDPNNGSSWFAGCIGGSPGKAYSPILAIPVSISGSTTFCSGGSAVLNATYVPGYAYQWRLNNNNIAGATDSTYSATQSGSYSVGVTYQGCAIISQAANITVVTQQPEPNTTDTFRCGTGAVMLIASASDSIIWYDANVGGNEIAVGDTLIIPNLSVTTTYYARAGRNCQSSSESTVATIINEAAAPVSSDVTRCGPGTVTLNATDTAAIRWYNAPSGGALLETGSSFLTNNLNNDTSFYVEAGSVCPSPRIEVHVTVNTSTVPTPVDASRCGSGSITLDATASDPISWFTSQYGGSSVATGNTYSPILTSTDTFYVEADGGCPSQRVPCIALIVPVPPLPIAADVAICNGSGSVILNATSTQQVNWFDAPSGGNLIYTGSVFVTPILSASTTYYISAGYDCFSNTIPVQAIISSPAAPPASSDVSRCGAGSVTLNATSTETIYWYSAPFGGTLLATSSSYTTPSISSTTFYYAEAGTYCRSTTRTVVQAIINTIPPSPVAPNVTNCGSGIVTLSATASQPISWYTTPTGGLPVGTGSTFNTPFISTTTTYYVEDGNDCASNRIPVQAIIAQQPAAPVSNNVSRCGTGTVSLTATATGTITWYNVPSGGSVLATGSNFTTPSISTTATYYVQADNGCSSTRTAVQAIVNPIPVPPVTNNESRCGNGSVTFSATSSEQIYWYTVASGGSPVSTGSTYNTPSLSSTTTYYVETGNACRSTRISVQAIITAVPSSPSVSAVSRCGPGTVTLSASSTAQVNWFDVTTGGASLGTGLNFTTPSLASTTTYFVEASNGSCLSARVPVAVTINPIPAQPVPTGNSRCGTGTIVLTATSSATVRWYLVATGGSLQGTGLSFTTPSISSTTTYYVEASSNGCSSSPRVAVQAVVNPIPSAPSAANVSQCGAGSVTLTASSPEQIYWYTVASGGAPVSTGSTYVTPVLSSTTTYYVEAGNNCRSSRISVQAIINNIPANPVLTNGTRCGTGTVTLTASSAATVHWYDVASGGVSIGTGLNFTTPSITATTTYYAEAGPTGCNSARVPVQAIVTALPTPPTSANISRCGPGSVTFTATGGGQIYWYTSSSGGSPVDSGLAYTTPSINSTKNYYLETSNGSCHSSRVTVQAIIVPLPAAPLVNDSSRCGAGSFILNASSPFPVYWYSAAVGGTLLSTGPTYTTPVLNSSTSYYVETGNACHSIRVQIQALIVSTPNAPVLIDTSRCGPGAAVIRAISSVQVNWFDVPSGGTAIDTGLYFTSPVISAPTTFYAEAGLGCNSARVPVQVTIDAVPAPPTATDSTRCGYGSVELEAFSSGQIYWYDSLTGGNQLSVGSVFTTPSLTATTTYFAETGDDCRSSRIPVQAILGGSQVTSVTGGSNCGPGSILLSATAAVSSDSIIWYDVPGGVDIGSGGFFISPFISTTTTYYVVARSGCTGLPVAVTAEIFTVPTVDIGPDTIVIQSGQTATLDAGTNFTSYDWSTSETTSDIVVSTTGMYSVLATDSNGCQAFDELFVNVITGINSVNGEILFNIFPNPAHGQLTIEIPDASSKMMSLKLYSAEGKKVKSEEIKAASGKFTKTLSLSGVSAGIYFLRLENDEYSATVKVVVE